MACCSSLMAGLKKILSKLGPIIAIALIACAAYFAFIALAGGAPLAALSGLTWLPTAISTAVLAPSTWAALALGAAIIIDSDTVTEAASSVAGAVGRVAGTVVGAVVAGATGGLVDGLTGGSSGSLLPIAIAVGLVWFFWPSDEDKKKDEMVEGDVPKGEAVTPASPVQMTPFLADYSLVGSKK